MRFLNNLFEILKFKGIKSKGYGTVPQAVLKDTSIDLISKSIYGLFCCFANEKMIAYPKRDTILAALNISKDCYYKHIKILIEKGLIKIKNMFGFIKRLTI